MKNKALILALISWQALYGAAEGSGFWSRMLGLFNTGSSLRYEDLNLLDPAMKASVLAKVSQVKLPIKWGDFDWTDRLDLMAKEMGTTLKVAKESSGRPDWYAMGPADTTYAKECDEYKIHLMPKKYSIDFIYDVMAQLMKNPILLENARGSKFQAMNIARDIDERILSRYSDIPPFIVIYANSKEKAQSVLNEIYRLFKDVPGSGFRPRFNGKLNDLIWFAQGNSNRKYPKDSPLHLPQIEENVEYEEPHRIYCSPDYPVAGTNHYLVHPETGEELVAIE